MAGPIQNQVSRKESGGRSLGVSTIKNISHGTSLPDDFILHLPPVASKWIDKYGLTKDEIKDNRIGWSEEGHTLSSGTSYAPCLVFPYYGKDNDLVAFQMRYMGDDKKLPKYFTVGNVKDLVHVLGETIHGKDRPICVVEDIISAIKVSRVCRCIPLFGSNLSLSMVNRIHLLTDSLIIWLDNDKYKEANKYASRYQHYFKSVDVIRCDKDPKEVNPNAFIGKN